MGKKKQTTPNKLILSVSFGKECDTKKRFLFSGIEAVYLTYDDIYEEHQRLKLNFEDINALEIFADRIKETYEKIKKDMFVANITTGIITKESVAMWKKANTDIQNM